MAVSYLGVILKADLISLWINIAYSILQQEKIAKPHKYKNKSQLS